MKKILLNQGELLAGKYIEEFPSDLEIENTPTLRQASLEMAMRYGGTLTRKCLDAITLTHSKKNIVVDTKVHYLMKGWCPSIPGWHTDGVPRGSELNPAGKGLPDMMAQAKGLVNHTIYHLIVIGGMSLTQFVKERNVPILIPDEPTRDLYKLITQGVKEKINITEFTPIRIDEGKAYTWDNFELHSAEWATDGGWRFLIRVTESDYVKPRESLEDIFRFQNMVYVNGDEVGW